MLNRGLFLIIHRLRRASTERGATAIEYAMMIALIAALIIALVGAIGEQTGFGFGSFNDNFQAVKPS